MRGAQGRGLASLNLPATDAPGSDLPPPEPTAIVRSVFRILRARPVHILGLAAVVFGTTAVLQALVDAKFLQGEFPDEVVAVAGVAVAVIGAFGFVFYAGLLDLVVGAYYRGQPDPSMREVLHQLPHGRLVLADAILVTICGLLALLFVVPGIVALTFFCLIGPVIVTEDHHVIAAFRRSARLVRPHFWMVLVMVVIPLLFEDAVLHAFNLDLVHNSLLDEFVVNALIGAALGSVVGLLEVVLAHEFRLRDPLPAADASDATVS